MSIKSFCQYAQIYSPSYKEPANFYVTAIKHDLPAFVWGGGIQLRRILPQYERVKHNFLLWSFWFHCYCVLNPLGYYDKRLRPGETKTTWGRDADPDPVKKIVRSDLKIWSDPLFTIWLDPVLKICMVPDPVRTSNIEIHLKKNFSFSIYWPKR